MTPELKILAIFAILFAIGCLLVARRKRRQSAEIAEAAGAMSPAFRRLVREEINAVPMHDRDKAIRAARWYCDQWQIGNITLAQAVSRTKTHLQLMRVGVVREPAPKPEPAQKPVVTLSISDQITPQISNIEARFKALGEAARRHDLSAMQAHERLKPCISDESPMESELYDRGLGAIGGKP